MFVILLASFIAIEAVLLKKHSRSLIAPSVLFMTPFTLMVLIAVLNFSNWELNTFSYQTLFVMLIGVVSFLLGVYFADRIRLSKSRTKYIIHSGNLTKGKLLFSLFIEIVATALYLFYMIRFGRAYGLGLGAAINYSMVNAKFHNGGPSVNLPYFANSLLICGQAFALLYMPALAKIIVYRKKGAPVVLLTLNIVIPVLSTLISGSRGVSLNYIIAFGIILLFEFYKKYHWKKALPAKFVFWIFVCGIIVVVVFVSVKSLIGRESQTTKSGFWEEIAVYIGAQIKNLDYRLQEGIVRNRYFGHDTFGGVYSMFSTYLHFSFPEYTASDSFVFINGKSLGNVYSCFYYFYKDGGILTVILFSLLFGFVPELLFRKARIESWQGVTNIWLPVFAIAGAHLFFSFFAARLLSNLLSAGFIRMLIWMVINRWYLARFSFSESNKSNLKLSCNV